MNMRPLALAIPILMLLGCKATAPRTEILAAADGLPLSYEIRGAGSPTLMFIHGWCCDRTFWDGQLESFGKKHRVVAIDLGGHGKSGTERRSWTIDQLAADACSVIRHEDLEDVVVVGHSMGGPVGLSVAASLPERVIGVIGVDTLQNADFDFPEESRRNAVRALEEDFTGRCAALSRGMVGPSASPELTEHIVQSMSEGPADVGIALMRDSMRYDPKAGLGQAGVPIICINAASERFKTRVDLNRKYAPEFDAIEMNGVGHFLMMERPAAFNLLLAEAIDRIACQPAAGQSIMP